MIKRLLTLFSSIRLTLFLFFSLAVTSILGTIVQQGLPLEWYQKFYSPGMFSALKFFNIFDMYHSWWFTTLLLLLSINVVVCTVRQIPRVMKLVSSKRDGIDDTIFKSSQIRKTFRSQQGLSDLERQSERLVQSLVGTPSKVTKNDVRYFFAEKGKYSRLGVTFVHASALLILAGGLIGTLWGFNGQMNIVEGEQSDTVRVFGGKEPKRLGFDVRCDDFTVAFYETGMPKEYKTEMTILEDEREVTSGIIRVNHPFVYEGIKFCQATYGIAGAGDLSIGVRKVATGEETVLKLGMMKKVPLPSGDAFLAVARFVADQGGMGPAVLGVLLEPGKAHEIFWIFQEGNNLNQRQKGAFSFTLKDFNRLYYTGLQVSKDPGVLLVWIGFCLILVGFVLHLFFTHKRIWLRIAGSSGQYECSIAASTSKDRQTFEEALERVIKELYNRQ
jgi:cytochrome c biogenesis protein